MAPDARELPKLDLDDLPMALDAASAGRRCGTPARWC